MTEKEKMIRGELYMGSGAELSGEHLNSVRLCREYNAIDPVEKGKRSEILKELCPVQGDHVHSDGPCFCDYGYNIHFGNNVYINYNCTILDVTTVTIGNDVLIGPSVEIYTAAHPVQWKQRATRIEFGKPVFIGNNVWIGGNTTICPGVSIGNRTIIGAGSVVTKDIPDDVIAAGNPARIIKRLDTEYSL